MLRSSANTPRPYQETWSTPLTLDEPGTYRVFADFKRQGENETLAADLVIDGSFEQQPLPAPATTATTADGYEVELAADRSAAGEGTELEFTVHRGGRPVEVETYLGAGGHGGSVKFETEFPTAGSHRLFLQFKHAGRVHTAAFTRDVAR